jgi:hypothetical protein
LAIAIVIPYTDDIAQTCTAFHGEREQPGMLEGQRHAEEDATPDEGRDEGVRADERIRARERQVGTRRRR